MEADKEERADDDENEDQEEEDKRSKKRQECQGISQFEIANGVRYSLTILPLCGEVFSELLFSLNFFKVLYCFSS